MELWKSVLLQCMKFFSPDVSSLTQVREENFVKSLFQELCPEKKQQSKWSDLLDFVHSEYPNFEESTESCESDVVTLSLLLLHGMVLKPCEKLQRHAGSLKPNHQNYVKEFLESTMTFQQKVTYKQIEQAIQMIEPVKSDECRTPEMKNTTPASASATPLRDFLNSPAAARARRDVRLEVSRFREEILEEIIEEREKLASKVDELQQKNKDLERAMAERRTEIVSLNEELESSQRDIEEANRMLIKAEEEACKKAEEIDGLNRTIKKLIEDLELGLKASYNKDSEISNLEKENEKMRVLSNRCAEEVEALRLKADKYWADKNVLMERCAMLERRLEEVECPSPCGKWPAEKRGDTLASEMVPFQLEELSHKIRELEDELKSARDTNSQLQESLQAEKAKSCEKDQKYTKLEEKYTKLGADYTATVMKFAEELQTTNDERNRLRTVFEEERKELNNLINDRTRQYQELDCKARIQQKECDLEKSQLLAQKEELSARITKIEEQLVQKNRELAEVEEKLSLQSSKLTEAEDEIRLKNSKLTEAEEEIRLKNSKLTEAEDEIRLKNSKLTEAEEEIRLKSSKLTEAEEEIRLKNSKLTEAEEEIRLKSSKLTEAEEEIRLKDSKLTEAEEEIRLKDSKLTNGAEELRHCESKLAEAVEEIRLKDTKLTEANEELCLRSKKLMDAEEEIRCKDIRLAEEEEVIRLKNTKLSEAEEEIRLKDSKLTEAEEEIRLKDSKLSEAEEKIRFKDTKLTELEEELCARNSKLTEAEEEIRLKNGKIAEAEEEIRLKDTRLAEAEEKIRHKDGKLTEAEEEILRRDSKLSEVEEELRLKNIRLTEAEEEIRLKNDKLIEADEELCVTKRKLMDSEEEIRANSEKVAEAEEEIRLKNKQLTDVQKDIALKDARLAELENMNSAKDKEIALKDLKLVQKEEEIALKDAVISERETEISEKSTTIEDKNSIISEKSGIIEEKKSIISDKDRIIAEKNSIIAEKVRVIEERDEDAAQKALVISGKEREIAELKEEIAKLQEELDDAKLEAEESLETQTALFSDFSKSKSLNETLEARVNKFIKEEAALKAVLPGSDDSSVVERVESLIAELKRSEEAFSQKTCALQSCEVQLKRLEDALSQRSNELEECKLRLKRAEEALSFTASKNKLQLKRSEEDLNLRSSELEKCQLQQKRSEEALKLRSSELEESKLQLKRSEEALNLRSSELEECKLKLKRSEESLNLRSSELDECKLQLKRSEESLSLRSSELEECKLQLKRSNEAINVSTSEVESLRLELKTIETGKQELEKSNKELSAEIEKLHLEVRVYEDQIQSLKNTVSEKESSFDQIVRERDELKKTFVEVEKNMQDAMAVRSKLESELVELRLKVEALESQKSSNEETVQNHLKTDKAIADLQGSLDGVIQQQKTEVQNHLTRLRSWLDRVTDSCDSLTRSLPGSCTAVFEVNSTKRDIEQMLRSVDDKYVKCLTSTIRCSDLILKLTVGSDDGAGDGTQGVPQDKGQLESDLSAVRALMTELVGDVRDVISRCKFLVDRCDFFMDEQSRQVLKVKTSLTRESPDGGSKTEKGTTVVKMEPNVKVENDDFEIKYKELQAAHNDLQTSYNNLETELKEVKENFALKNEDHIHKHYAAKLETLKIKMNQICTAEINKIQEGRDRAERQMIAQHEKTVAEYRSHVQSQASQVWELNEKLIQREQEIKALQVKLSKLQDKFFEGCNPPRAAAADPTQNIRHSLSVDWLDRMGQDDVPLISRSRPDRQSLCDRKRPEPPAKPKRAVLGTSMGRIEEGATNPSRAAASGNAVMAPASMGVAFPEEDEDGELFNNTYLADMKSGRTRLNEFQQRNSMCPPHLKSSYPGETQFHDPKLLNEDEIKVSHDGRRLTKDRSQTSYKRPGPPTPSKNGRRLSLQGKEETKQVTPRAVLQEPNRQSSGSLMNILRPGKTTPSRLRALFTSSKVGAVATAAPTHLKGDENEAPLTPTSKRMSIFRKRFGPREPPPNSSFTSYR